MNTIEIMCDACEAKMRLSANLLHRLEGRCGRITCKQCSNKVFLDASGENFAVTAGGVLIEGKGGAQAAQPHDDPHLSEIPTSGGSESRMPANVRFSVPPPLPAMARIGRSTFARGTSVAASQDLSRMKSEGSLSPHTFDETQSGALQFEDQHSFDDELSLAALTHDIRSTPYSAPPPRDQSYNSLFPEPQRKSLKLPSTVPFGSRAPVPPRAGELHRSMAPAQNPFETGYGIDVPQGPQAVVVTADGQLLNQSDLRSLNGSSLSRANEEKGSKAPWILAAAALFALGLSLSAQTKDGVSRILHLTDHQKVVSATAEPVVIHSASVPEVLIAAPDPRENDAEESVSDDAAVRTKLDLTETRTLKSQTTQAPVAKTSGASVEEPVQPSAAPFSPGLAAASMREATSLSSSCRSASDPSGSARVVVTFSPSGRVTSATVSGPPYAGTITGGCIAARFRAARVPAFSGQAVTVSKTVTIH